MLPWLFLEPDVLCYLPVRATNSACVCVGRSLSNIKEISAEIMNQLLGSLSCLVQAPSSLLEALEQHLASLEGKKTKELNADTK